MSLAIDVDKVDAVLIAGKWYTVELDAEDEISTFDLDAYEFLDGERLAGSMSQSPTGYTFRTIMNGASFWMHGPITAIQGIRTKER